MDRALAASSAALSRTWATEPGADSTRSVCTVWIESTTTRRGPRSRQVDASSSTLVVGSSRRSPGTPPSRSARSRICAGPSSPHTYRTGPRCFWRWAASWSASVDLPMPGSPPSSTTEPGTSPPPSTRSSSGSPVPSRGASAASTSSRASATAGSLATRSRLAPGSGPVGSSTRLSQAPQAVQRPSQRGCWEPHSVQQKTVRALATPGA